MPVATRTGWVRPHKPLPLTRQGALTGVTRSTLSAPHPVATPDEQELTVLGLIDAESTRHPFYGSRKIRQYLRGVGHPIHRTRVQRLMGILGLAGMAPGPNTSRPHPQHTVYPSLRRGVVVPRPNQVGSTDITYIRLARGLVYLVAVLDWYSRRVLSWRWSNTLESGFCVEGLEHAVQSDGIPEIFNTDQGCQFTAEAFTGVLKAHGIAISMDGRGRALENSVVERLWRSVKYEDVYLRGYTTLSELQRGLTDYVVLYNTERRQQSLAYLTPDEVYRSASGGGARIVDQFGETASTLPETPQERARRGSAVPLPVHGYPLKLTA
jgi:putative transposase